jgi:hypothetical protein
VILYEGYRTLKLGTWKVQQPLHTLQTFTGGWLYGVQILSDITTKNFIKPNAKNKPPTAASPLISAEGSLGLKPFYPHYKA